MALQRIFQALEQQPKLSQYKPRLSPVESEPQGNSLNTLGAILDMIARNATPAPTADGGMNAPMVPTGAYTPPQAPRLNTSGSDSMFASGNAALGNAMNAPQISAPTNPNTESILLALAPALFGAGTSYLPGLAGGYLQGQKEGQAQKEAQRQEQIKRDVMLAQGTLDNAERERTKEIGIFNQENQTFRNDQDNLRMEENAIRADKRMRDLAEQKAALDGKADYRKFLEDRIDHLVKTRQSTEKEFGRALNEQERGLFEKAVMATVEDINRMAKNDGLDITFTPDFILAGAKARAGQLGELTLGGKKAADTNANNDLKAYQKSYGDAIAAMQKKGTITDVDRKALSDFVKGLPEDVQDVFIIPTAGETVAMFTARSNAANQARRAKESERHNKVTEGQGSERNDIGWFNATKPTTGKGKATDYSSQIEGLKTKLVDAEAKFLAAEKYNDLEAKSKYRGEIDGLNAQITRLEALAAGEKKNEPVAGRGVASVRNNNPGAMWIKGNKTAQEFGATGGENLSDGLGQGNNIARFANAIDGGAAQFALLAKGYMNRTVSEAIRKWSGGNNVGSYLSVMRKYGVNPGMTLTKDFLFSDAGIQFVKAMAHHEAGAPFPMGDDGWREAQNIAKSKLYGDKTPTQEPPSSLRSKLTAGVGVKDNPPATKPEANKPTVKPKTVTGAKGNTFTMPTKK